MELQIEDLRAGNWFCNQQTGFPFKITENDILFIEQGGDICSYKPIPITSFLIEKCKFNCANRPKMYFKKYHNEENADFSALILKDVGNNPIWAYSAKNRWTINPFTIEISYLHELQNLFREHSKTNLTINL